MKQREIAKKIGITEGRLSQILAGDSIGRKVAQAMADVTGDPWTDFLTMPPELIREKLETACGAE